MRLKEEPSLTEITLLAPLARAKKGTAALGAAGIGVGDDHRVADLTLLSPPAVQWNATAALAAEVLSQHEPSDRKLALYAAHHVDELVIIDPDQRTVCWLELSEGAYEPCSGQA